MEIQLPGKGWRYCICNRGRIHFNTIHSGCLQILSLESTVCHLSPQSTVQHNYQLLFKNWTFRRITNISIFESSSILFVQKIVKIISNVGKEKPYLDPRLLFPVLNFITQTVTFHTENQVTDCTFF